MFRNSELLTRWEKIMHQKDIERFAFLYLCGRRDRAILAGTERMTFEDFDRLAYITDFLGMDQMNLEIWNLFSWQFCEQFQAIERLRKENCRNMEFRICYASSANYGIRKKQYADRFKKILRILYQGTNTGYRMSGAGTG